MFVDMVNSLTTIRDADPEEAHDLFSEALILMSNSIHAYGGVVARTLGDGIMALFGAPAAQEDHATRAALAALRLQEQLSRADKGTSTIRARIGIHSGIVAIGGSPNDFAVDYDVTGVVVHLAARLQSFAPPGKAVVTARTNGLISRDIVTEFMATISVKGLAEPIDTYVLVGPTENLRRPSAPGSGEFIGRSRQLRALISALGWALKGKGALVAVSGQAGAGKTTLIEKFIDQCPQFVRTFVIYAERYGGSAPFQPFRDLMLQLFELETLLGDERKNAISAQLTKLGSSSREYRDALYDLCDVPVESATWKDFDPRRRRQSIVSVTMEILALASSKQPIAIVIEDIQRTDASSLELIGTISGERRLRNVLFIVTYRSDFIYTWPRGINIKPITVNNLTRIETDRLLRGLLGSAASAPLATVLYNRSGGNPLFLFEFVRNLSEAGVLDGLAKHRTSLKGTWEIAAPLSIAAIIAERIDGLSPDLREVILAASVLEERFSFDILAKIAGLPEIEIDRRIRLLEQAQIVRPAKSKGFYSFVHGLFQEVTYDTLLKRRRQKLHEAAFKALSATQSMKPSIEQLAHHAFNGGVWSEALKYCWLAGRRAAARWSHREAVAHLENAVIAHARGSLQLASLCDAIDLRLELRLAHLPLLHLSRVGELLKEAQVLAIQNNDQHRLSKIIGLMGGHAYLTESPVESMKLCRKSLSLAVRERDKRIKIAPSLYLAQAQYALGRMRQVV